MQSNESKSGARGHGNGNGGNPKVKAVFTIIEDEKLTRPIFRRIGTAFVNGDQSLNVFLDALPVSGKLHIRDAQVFKGDGTQEGNGRPRREPHAAAPPEAPNSMRREEAG